MSITTHCQDKVVLTNYKSVVTDPVYKQPPELFYKKCVLRNFTKFSGKYL